MPLHVLFPYSVVALATGGSNGGPTGVARDKGGGILRSEYEAEYRQSITPNHLNFHVLYQSRFSNKFSH